MVCFKDIAGVDSRHSCSRSWGPLHVADPPLAQVICMCAGGLIACSSSARVCAGGDMMDREYAQKVLSHAEALGFTAIFVTVDTPNTGNRYETFGNPAFVQVQLLSLHPSKSCASPRGRRGACLRSLCV
eukprot:SAG11_NODE_1689_length_4443_cov_7.468002_3_plen_129_part_00